MSAAPPPPVSEVDRNLKQSLKGFHRQRWAAVAGVIAGLVIAVVLLGLLAWQQHGQLRASCGFFQVLSPLPVTAPAAQKPSPVGVTLIAASRTAYAGQGCGHLPPAAPSLVKWAAYYGIRLP